MEQEQFKKDILPLRPRLQIYAERIMENTEDAEDIIQEVFLKLWNMRDNLIKYDNIYALSIKITKHLCINHIKIRNRNQGELKKDFPINENLLPDSLLEIKEDNELLIRIIKDLPDLQSAIFQMKHVDGLEVEEIADLTGSNPEAIRMNLSRARRKVKDLFFKIR